MSDEWEEKSPSLQLYVRDWLTDVALRSCSRSARGVWIDALCLMHLSPIRGKLEAETRADLCSMLGGTVETISADIDELIRKRVASSDGPGSLINRRMFHTAKVSASRSEAGKLGAHSRWQKMANRCEGHGTPPNKDSVLPQAETINNSIASEFCHSKDNGKNTAKMATASSSSYAVLSTKRESSTSRAREELSLSENFDGRIFDVESFDPASGRCRLKRFEFVWLKAAELTEAKKIWCESNALTQEEWRQGMHRLNAYCEPKQNTADFKRGLAYKQLLGIILTDALAQKKNKKDPNTNGTHAQQNGRAYQTYKRPERSSGVPEQIGNVLRRAQTENQEGAPHGKKSE